MTRRQGPGRSLSENLIGLQAGLRHIDGVLATLQAWVMFILAILVVGIMCLMVFLRYVLRMDLFGMEEIIVMVGIWMYFVGAAFASRSGRQITADVLLESLRREEHKLALRVVTSFITLSICLLVDYWAFNYLVWGITKAPHSAIYSIPLVIPQSAVFAGLSLMSLYSMIDFLRLSRALVRGLPSPRQ